MYLEGGGRVEQLVWWQGRQGGTGGRDYSPREKEGHGGAGWGCAVVGSKARELDKGGVLEDDVHQGSVRKRSVYTWEGTPFCKGGDCSSSLEGTED